MNSEGIGWRLKALLDGVGRKEGRVRNTMLYCVDTGGGDWR